MGIVLLVSVGILAGLAGVAGITLLLLRRHWRQAGETGPNSRVRYAETTVVVLNGRNLHRPLWRRLFSREV